MIGLAGMARHVRGLQLGDGELEITLGRSERAMAEDLLDVAQVGFVLQQMCGATVSPQMTGDALLDPGEPRIFFHDAAEGVAGDRQSALREEQSRRRGTGFISEELRADGVRVAFEEGTSHGR